MGTIVDDDAFLERTAAIGEHARAGLIERRKHPGLIFLWLPGDELRVEPLQRRFESERRGWTRVVRSAVDQDARGIIFAGEGWADDGAGELAESLIVAALTRTGRMRLETTAFERVRGQALELEEPRVREELAPFLVGIADAWSVPRPAADA